MRLALRAAFVAAAGLVGALLAAPPATPPQPLVIALGLQTALTGALVAEVAYDVDRVPVPVPVPGTPSCSRLGCR